MVNAYFLTLVMSSILVSVVQRVFPPHPHVLLFSLWCLVLEYLLVALLVWGSKVRKDLRHHFVDVTLLKLDS